MRPCWLPVLLFTMLAASARAADGDCSWFRSAATGSGWWITEGRGDFTESSDRFDATLRDGTDTPFVRLTLHGTLTNGTVTARVRVENSDARDADMSGRLTRECWSNGGREIIVVSNPDHTDVIGMERNLAASAPCTPVR